MVKEPGVRDRKVSRLPWPVLLGLSQLPAILVSLGLIALWSAETASGRLFTLFDDAMVSMSYAKTYAVTGELVWFTGADSVQGFSNPLWTMWMTVLHFAGLQGSGAALAVSLSGLALIVGVGILVSQMVRDLLDTPAGSHGWALTAGGATSLSFPLMFWPLRGMEVGLMALLWMLMVVAMYRWIRNISMGKRAVIWAVVALVAAVLGIATRLDFAVLAGASALVLLLSPGQARVARIGGLVLGAVSLLAVAGVAGWQAWIFGDPLPVTYYLKVEGVSAAERVVRGLVVTAKLLPFLIVSGVAYIYALRSAALSGSRKTAAHVLAAGTAAVVVYQVWTGGDAWEWTMLANRFATVVLPSAVVLVTLGMAARTRALAKSPPTQAFLPSWLIVTLLVASLGAGIQANPVRFDLVRAGVAVMVMALVIALLVGTWRTIGRRSGRTDVWLPLAGATGLWAMLSILPLTYSLSQFGTVGPFVDFDVTTVNRAQALASVVDKPLRVATVRAGADSYYSGQAMIDILGKNDPVIARSAPHREVGAGEYSTFYPGHDKWDYSWSIETLRPDVIMDMWVATPNDYAWLSTLGYVRVCLPDTSQVWASEAAIVANPRLQVCGS